MRGFTAVDDITPKAAEETLPLGPLNCGELNALKNSARNSRLPPSPNGRIRVCLIAARSKLRWSGPDTIPTPLLPNAVATPSAPITGQIAVPAVLRKMQLRVK